MITLAYRKGLISIQFSWSVSSSPYILSTVLPVNLVVRDNLFLLDLVLIFYQQCCLSI